MNKRWFLVIGIAGSLVASQTLYAQSPVGTAFTYQGLLTDGGTPADGLYDFRFFLYDAEMGGSQVGPGLDYEDQDVRGGLITFKLDFGGVFDGEALWLEVWVRRWDSGGAYDPLSPRQELTGAPYALYALAPDFDGCCSLDEAYDEGRVITADAGAVQIVGSGGLAVDGDVGIGTTSPTAKLDVVGTISGDGLAIDGSISGSGFSGWDSDASDDLLTSTQFSGDVTGPYNAIEVLDDSHSHGDGTVSDSISINNGRLYAPAGSGNVGIGTTSPAVKLHVAGDVAMTNLAANIISCDDLFVENDAEIGDDLNVDGALHILDNSRRTRVQCDVSGDGAGRMMTLGPNGSYNVRCTYTNDCPDHGYISVRDASDVNQAGIYVNCSGQGIVWGDVKSFRTPNPYRPDTDIWYACIEGPEAAAYIRGTGHLIDGRAVVAFPEHFIAVASPHGMTVQVTPRSAESPGLAVVDSTPEGFVVRELLSGRGTYDFDYIAFAVRKGHEDYRVIRSAREGLPGPDPGGEEAVDFDLSYDQPLIGSEEIPQ